MAGFFNRFVDSYLDAIAWLAYRRRSCATRNRVAISFLNDHCADLVRVIYQTKGVFMSRRCELTGVGPMVGHNVSHSNVKTKRRFLPSLRQVDLHSETIGQSFRLKITNAALRTLDFRGGLDVFLIKADDADLSLRARRLKKQIKDKMAQSAA